MTGLLPAILQIGGAELAIILLLLVSVALPLVLLAALVVGLWYLFIREDDAEEWESGGTDRRD